MALKDVLTLDMDGLVKPYLRVDHSAEDDILKVLVGAAIKQADDYLNREIQDDAEELANIKLACLQAIAKWYENRGDTSTLPPEAKDILNLYRYEPGF